MDYIITNEAKTVFVKIAKDGRIVTCGKNEAEIFPETKAKNLAKTIPNIYKKFHLKAVPYVASQPNMTVEETPKLVASGLIKPISKNVNCGNGAKESEAVMDWANKAEEVGEFYERAKKRKTELNNELSEVDKELAALDHYTEFSNLNAAQGYKANQMRKETLIRRRKIKDEILVVDIIIKSPGETMSKGVKTFLKTMEKRTYTPKVRTELFV